MIVKKTSLYKTFIYFKTFKITYWQNIGEYIRTSAFKSSVVTTKYIKQEDLNL